MCAEARLAWLPVMDSMRLAEAPRSAGTRQPSRCQQRQRYKYLTLGELCLYAASKWAKGRDNGVREMEFPLQLAACKSIFPPLVVFLPLCLHASGALAQENKTTTSSTKQPKNNDIH